MKTTINGQTVTLSPYRAETSRRGAEGSEPFRGPCGPQAFWALEQAIDEAAYKLHRDPLELRRCWYSKHPLRLKLLDWAMALPAWAQRGPVASTSGRFRRGIGVAAVTWPFTYNPSTKVEVRTTPGGLLARCATQDSGSGTRTVLAQAVAEVFALPPDDVLVHIGDSSAPLGPGSFASQVMNSVYGPARDAATEVRDHLLEAARTQLRLSNVQAVTGGIKHAGGFMSWHMLLQQTQPYTAVQERDAERGPLGIPLRLPGDENSLTPGFRQAHALNPSFRCYKRGGESCPSREGNHSSGVIFDVGPCVFPHPSTLGMALLAYEAQVEIAGHELRPVAALYGDGSDPTRDHKLGANELLTRIVLPPPLQSERTAYVRAISRAQAEWPLVETLVRLVIDDGVITTARVGVGGVANIPLRLANVEVALIGQPATDTSFENVAQRASEGATPLPMTQYKVNLLRGTVYEALQRACSQLDQ